MTKSNVWNKKILLNFSVLIQNLKNIQSMNKLKVYEILVYLYADIGDIPYS
jgi:hypothetical protein